MCHLVFPKSPSQKRRKIAIELFIVEKERLNHSSDIESERVEGPKEVFAELLKPEPTVVLFKGW